MSSVKSVFCSHCNTEVAERTFRQHKAAFYDSFRNTWRQTDTAISPLKKRPRQINSDEELGSEVESANEFETTSLDDDLDSIQTEDVIFEEIHLDPICAFVSEKIEEVWENESVEDVIADLSTACLSDIATTKCSSEGSTSTREATIELTRWILLFVGSWSTAFNIPMSAVEYFLLFLHAVFSVCSAFSPALSLVVDVLPKSIYQFKKSQGFLYDDFKKYAVCPKCHALYDLKVCDKSKSGPPRCTFIQHPNHPQKRFREQCGTELFREIILTNGSKKYYPVKTFCWKSIRETLQAFLNRKGFQKSCEAWRNRTLIPGTLRDVYDGRVWKSFQNLESVGPFLQLPRRFGLMLNVDWFQPFKHSPYSVGVIYLAILNLPREIRFTKDNVMIVGVIPGPGEPSKSINTYLEPIVAELLELWTDGFSCKGVDDAKEEQYYAALLCSACDVPAARKVGGFLGHSAKLGCSRCKKEFKTAKFGEKVDYGGFEKNSPRTDQEHRQIAQSLQEQTTSTKRQTLESKHGVRYTELMKLPYFNVISFTVIDPMHNLFLGTTKYMMKTVWVEKLDNKDLCEIQKKIDDMVVPTSLGRIPHKIQSSFTSFTSDQWKNWTLYFSPIVMKDYLPGKDFLCWMMFVEGCRILCTPFLTLHRLKLGHEKLMAFLRSFENLYGSKSVTPNMHLHTHIIECIIDYGPMHSFWLYSFERMNGVLGSVNTNQRSVEIQLMRKMTQCQTIAIFERPELYSEIFGQAFEYETDKTIKNHNAGEVLQLLALSSEQPSDYKAWFEPFDLKFIGSRQNVHLTDHKVEHLRQALQTFSNVDPFSVSGSCHKYKNIEIFGEKYGSSDSRLSRSSVVLASWCGSDGEINMDGNDERCGIVRFYLSVFVPFNGSTERLTLAYVHWFQKVYCQKSISSVASVWCHKLFEPEGPACFMPVQRIKGKCICSKVTINNEELLAVVPYVRQLFW